MHKRSNYLPEIFMVAVIAVLSFARTCLAGPPPPPNVPATPVGATEVTIATVVAIAGYGYWKSRK